VLQAARSPMLELLFNSLLAFRRTRPDLADQLLGSIEHLRPTYGLAVGLLAARDPAAARESSRAVLSLQETLATESLPPPANLEGILRPDPGDAPAR
jgi:uncharacterized protein HemY